MKRRRSILITGLTALLTICILIWLFDWFWHYPQPRQSNEEPAAADG
jgi:hypothetical protein